MPTYLPILISAVALLVAIASATFAGLNYFAGKRERDAKSSASTPHVRLHIGGPPTFDGWRQCQLHVMPPSGLSPEESRRFPYDDWAIEEARLLGPAEVRMARILEGTGEPDRQRTVPMIRGAPALSRQRFALEFFLRLPPPEVATVRMQVPFVNLKTKRRLNKVVQARVWVA